MDNNDEEKSSMNNNKSSFHIPEGINEEFSCDHLIQMQESVEDCTLLTDIIVSLEPFFSVFVTLTARNLFVKLVYVSVIESIG